MKGLGFRFSSRGEGLVGLPEPTGIIPSCHQGMKTRKKDLYFGSFPLTVRV